VSERKDLNIVTNNLESFSSYNMEQFNINEKKINDDISITVVDSNLTKDDKPYLLEGGVLFKGLLINTTLNGSYDYNTNKYKFISNKNTTNILSIEDNFQSLQFTDNSYKGFSILIKNEFLLSNNLERFSLDNFKNLPLKNDATSLLTKKYIQEILNSPYSGAINDLFIQGKVFELLANEFSSLCKEKEEVKKKVILNKDDVEALKKAKIILSENIINPPTLKELSRMVALNEFKLKTGFRTLFKTTPYSIVKDQRMKLAKELLESSEYNISEISKMVGIKCQASFTKSFFSFYKVLPKDVMKSRKYYY